jgi:GcvH upstream region-like protein
MLNFLRKHQKIFFIVITATIVVSFCFFGTYSTLGQQEAVPDKEVVRGVGGAPIMQQECFALCRLIENSPYDRSDGDKRGMPNFLNDGVIEKDFLGSGLGVMLAKNFFDELKDELDQRVKKIRHYRPYVHPRSALISAEGAWARFSPSLLEQWRLLRNRSEQSTSPETFVLMAQLYLEQAKLPPSILKQILVMQQNQAGVQPDPVLGAADLGMFGFKSMEDWFGPRYVTLVAQFILNAAQIAEENGYDVKIDEVRSELFQNIYQGCQQQMSAEETGQYYQMKIRNLGLDEATLIRTWKKVMLFRRLFDDASGSVLIDPLAYHHFDQFAKENVRVSLYQLPKPVQFADFRSMLKFQLYLEAVASDPSRLRIDLRIPKQFASLDQIEKRIPELVERRVEIEWSEVAKEDLSRTISVRQTWDWEVADPHWDLIKLQFSELGAVFASAAQERLAALEKLDKKLRVKVDQFARSKMVDEQKDKIKLALDIAPVKTSTVGLRMKGTVFPFTGVADSAELLALIENASLKEETANAASQRLQEYTPDTEHYYRIHIVRRGGEKKVLDFDDAIKDGTLDKVLDKRLEDAYPEVRKRNAREFQQSNGQWKPFKEVKDLIAKLHFDQLLRSIENQYRSYFGILPGKEGSLPLVFYSNARLLPFLLDVKSTLQANPQDTSWIATDCEKDLSSQWLLEKTEKVMQRCTEVPFSKEEMFQLLPQQWSPVKVGERGAIAFYYVQEKGIGSASALETIEKGHQILSIDAKRDMMLQVLQKIQKKKAIDLSIAVSEEQKPHS